MLGNGGSKYADLDGDGNGQPETVVAPDPRPAYNGATSQNIDLNNIDVTLDLTAAIDTPAAEHGDGVDANMAGWPGYDNDYELTGTLCNPSRTDKCQIENIVMSISLVLTFVLGIASLSATQLSYKKGELEIFINTGFIRGCIAGVCTMDPVRSVMCDSYHGSNVAYALFTSLAVVLSLVAFTFSICNVCGCACCWRYLVAGLAIVVNVFLLIAVACNSSLRSSKHCNGVSLGSLRFKFGPGFALVLTPFLTQFVSIVFYFVVRCCRPVKYRHR